MDFCIDPKLLRASATERALESARREIKRDLRRLEAGRVLRDRRGREIANTLDAEDKSDARRKQKIIAAIDKALKG